MTPEQLIGLAKEMELDPQGYDILDLDKLLQESGFECYAHAETLVYTHPGVPFPIALPRNVRYVPARVVVFVTGRVLQLLEG